MSRSKFDPYEYKGRKTILRSLPNHPGISVIWYWSKTKKKYCKQTVGNIYSVAKRVSGKQKTKVFPTLVKAKEYLHSDEFDEHSSRGLKFHELKDKFFVKKRSDIRVSTIETYKSKAKHLTFFNDYLVDDITPKVIDEWLQYLKRPAYLKRQHKSRLSYRHELSTLRQILDYYAEYICNELSYSLPVKKRHWKDCIIDKAKYDLSRAKNKTKFLTRHEIERFLFELKSGSEKKPINKVFFYLAYFHVATGTRIGEACAIHWEDIDFSRGSVNIHRNVCWKRAKGRETFVSPLTKTGENREVYPPKSVLDELKKLKLASGKSKGLVFTQDGNKPIEYRTVQHHYDKALKAVGSEWRGTHIMRHSFATDFLEKTQNPKALQGALGHKTAQQTNHYAKITQSLVQKGMDEYSDSFSEISKSL